MNAVNHEPSSLTTASSNNTKRPPLVVGVLGGLGPHATIDFMERVMDHTPASIDQDHVPMLVHHNPRVPSRQDAILHNSKNVGDELTQMAVCLQRAGADFLVMPCNLGHYWEQDISAKIQIPFISIIDVTVQAAIQKPHQDNTNTSTPIKHTTKIGLFTTPGCHSAGLYQEALRKAGCKAVLQTPEELQQTMLYVNQIKAGDKNHQAIVQGLQEIGNALITRGATVLIAACTELPLVLHNNMFHVPFISSTDELAKRTVAKALGVDGGDDNRESLLQPSSGKQHEPAVQQ